jgi:hypothetical protein
VLVSTPHEVSLILIHYPQCIYSCVFCLSIASLSCFDRSYQRVSQVLLFSSSCFLVSPDLTFLPVLTLTLIDSALDYEPLLVLHLPFACPFVNANIRRTELYASCVCIWVIIRLKRSI